MMIGVMVMLAATQVFRLELTDETPYIVGADGVRREVVLVASEEYAALTNQAVVAWRRIHETEEGRRRIHGKRVNTTVKCRRRVDTYADGFKATYPMSPKHLEFRAKLDAARKKQPVTVTVEHDAATGKDSQK